MNPIFKNISAQETEKYLKNTKAKTLNYKKDAFIFFEGDTPAFIFVLKSGIVQIEKNTADINDVSLVLRSFSKMTGMRYYSNSRKRYETLYTDVHCVNNPEEKKSVPDPLDVSTDALVSYVYQKDRSLSGCVYRFSFFQTQNEIGARAVNTDEVQYKGFSILKPEHLVLNVHAVQTKEGIVFYILVRADAAKIPLVPIGSTTTKSAIKAERMLFSLSQRQWKIKLVRISAIW